MSPEIEKKQTTSSPPRFSNDVVQLAEDAKRARAERDAKLAREKAAVSGGSRGVERRALELDSYYRGCRY